MPNDRVAHLGHEGRVSSVSHNRHLHFAARVLAAEERRLRDPDLARRASDLGRTIRAARLLRNLTPQAAARRSHLPARFFLELEGGLVDPATITPAMLDRVAAALTVPPALLQIAYSGDPEFRAIVLDLPERKFPLPHSRITWMTRLMHPTSSMRGRGMTMVGLSIMAIAAMAVMWMAM